LIIDFFKRFDYWIIELLKVIENLMITGIIVFF